MNTKLKVLDLYSGIGGFSLGFHRAGGFETVGFCEIDEHCGKVLKKNFPDVYVYKDVKDFHGNMNIKIKDIYMPFKNNVDVICGGFPCQDVSVAGKQKGFIDEKTGERTRSGLWIEFKRIIKEVRPRWVVIENVRNLLNNGLAIVLQDLHEIGYDAEWEVISARSVGSCHLRERIWIVAYSKCERFKRCEHEADKKRQTSRLGEELSERSCFGESSNSTSNSDDFRFWPSFATKEEKQQWWTKATSSFRNWWEVESSVCRVDDGLPSRLDKGRSQRIKQLGNSIVPQIAEIIGKRIMFHEVL
jgi:DNA (cytosine-5)-methyltransferase 1